MLPHNTPYAFPRVCMLWVLTFCIFALLALWVFMFCSASLRFQQTRLGPSRADTVQNAEVRAAERPTTPAAATGWSLEIVYFACDCLFG